MPGLWPLALSAQVDRPLEGMPLCARQRDTESGAETEGVEVIRCCCSSLRLVTIVRYTAAVQAQRDAFSTG